MAEVSSIRFGPPPAPPRDGDKIQARQRINVEVRTGRRPHPNSIPCVGCGHVWKEGERRHEYHHHNGYEAAHHYDVIPLCTLCHVVDDNRKPTHCIHGHEFTTENTYQKSNGTRACRACMRRHDQKRPPRGSDYWRKVNDKRRGKSNG